MADNSPDPSVYLHYRLQQQAKDLRYEAGIVNAPGALPYLDEADGLLANGSDPKTCQLAQIELDKAHDMIGIAQNADTTT